MRYPAIVTSEGKYTLAEFPDCPGCQTFADAGQEIGDEAREALTGWLESTLKHGDPIPRPSERKRAPKGARLLWVEVPPVLAIKLALRTARSEVGLSQSELARRAGVTQQMIAKVEDPDYSPGLGVLEKVVRALGARLEINLVGI